MKLFASRWVNSHMQQSRLLGKPFVLEEFGASTKRGNGTHTYEALIDHREDLFETIFVEMEDAAKAQELGTGSLFWTFSSIHYPDFDGFTIRSVVARAQLHSHGGLKSSMTRLAPGAANGAPHDGLTIALTETGPFRHLQT